MTAPAPTVCRRCDGDQVIRYTLRYREDDDAIITRVVPCHACVCAECGTTRDVNDGMCGGCYDDADALAVRRADR